jgi:hypothetical protein
MLNCIEVAIFSRAATAAAENNIILVLIQITT